MRIALAQINPTVGDLAGNVAKTIRFLREARDRGAEVVVFPELSITGYPPKDLLLKPQFVQDNLQAVQAVAAEVHGIDVIIGYAHRNAGPVGRPLHNAVALLRDGAVVSRHFKTLLPTYDVFDESRYFEPGPVDETENLVRLDGVVAGMTICEDLWNDEKMVPRRLYHQNPVADLHAAGAQILINSSASPFVVHKHAFRQALFSTQVRRFGIPLIYVNQVGGNDDLVFDGNSMVIAADGTIVANAKAFEVDLLICDIDVPEKPPIPPQRPAVDLPFSILAPTEKDGVEQIYHALVLGTRDYCRKCGFKSIVLGLSGGIDSALVAALAVDALGNDKVVGVAMPSRFSSGHSVADAKALAENLGIAFHVVPIKDVHHAYEQTLSGVFVGLPRDVTEENLQARVRGALLMAFSNKFNHLLLTTGNKSELATGYCTLYGDMCGGLAVISDVPKMVVYALARWINVNAGRTRIPVSSIEKAPSAELRPDQTDQDSLPPYPVLDAILQRYVEEEQSAAGIVAAGFDPATVHQVIRLVDRSEYKRRQAAPGLKVTSRAFGSGRRMPIAQDYRQTAPRG